jgi:hypothetical protein
LRTLRTWREILCVSLRSLWLSTPFSMSAEGGFQ